jgi:hypothetical protein
LNELPGCQRRWVAIGEVDLGVDLRSLTFKPPPKDEIMLGCRTVYEDLDLLAESPAVGTPDDLLL